MVLGNKKSTAVVETLIASEFQKDIYHWVEFGNGNAIVEAVAGSGKTTVLKQACRIIYERWGIRPLAIAFNSHIKKELELKIGEYAQVNTFNSLGHGLVGNAIGRKYLKVDDDKYHKICKAVVVDQNGYNDYEQNLIYVSELKQLSDFCMKTLTRTKSKDDLKEMISNYNLDVDNLDVVGSWLGYVIKEGDKLARQGIISFTDQLFLPHLWNLSPIKKYEWVLGDEMQDTSSASLELFLKFTDERTRILAVGDRKQAIMGFGGANSDALDRLQNTINAISLPLSICYRCPTAHIELAQELVPQILPSPTAIEGEIIEVYMKMVSKGRFDYEELIPHLGNKELIICRKTAPLISLCIKLITQRISAKVKGRDIGAQLGKLIDETAKLPGFHFNRFPEFLENLFEMKKAKFLIKNEQGKIESLQDRVNGLHACFEAFHDAYNVESLKESVNNLFSDSHSTITLSTIHKAKGLEADRVVFLHPEFCPMKWEGQNKEMYEQELNLKYVALTRSKHTLILCYGTSQRKGVNQSKKVDDWAKEYKESKSSYSNPEDYFKGCSTTEQIQERYRTLAKQFHPDMKTGDIDKMKELNNQYDKLMEK